MQYKWYYESDGDPGRRTFYLLYSTQESSSRIDFESKQDAITVINKIIDDSYYGRKEVVPEEIHTYCNGLKIKILNGYTDYFGLPKKRWYLFSEESNANICQEKIFP